MVATRRSIVTAFAVAVTLVISGCASFNLPNPFAGKEAGPAAKPALKADPALAKAKQAQAAPAAVAKPAEAATPAPAATPVKRVYERIASSCRPIIDLACGNVTPKKGEETQLLQDAHGEPNGAKFAPYYVKKTQLSLDAFIAQIQGGDHDKVLVTAEQYHAQLATMGVPVSPGGKTELVKYLRSDRVTTVACTPDLLKGVNMGRYDPKTGKFNFLWSREKCLPDSQLVMDCDVKDVTPPPPPPAAAPAAKPAPAPVVSTTNGACTSSEREFHVNIFDEGKSPEIESCRKGASMVLGSADSFSTACTVPLLRKESATSGKRSWRIDKPFVIKVASYDTADPKVMLKERDVTIENGYGVFSEVYADIKGKALKITFPSQAGFNVLSPSAQSQLHVFPKEFEKSSCRYQFSGSAKVAAQK